MRNETLEVIDDAVVVDEKQGWMKANAWEMVHWCTLLPYTKEGINSQYVAIFYTTT